MKNFAICAFLAVGVSAVPMAAPKHAHGHQHQKRDVVWVTETAVDTVTDVVVKTVVWDGKSYSTQGGQPATTVLSTATVHPVAYSPSSSATAYTSTSEQSTSTSVAYSAPASSAPGSTSTAAAAYTSTSEYVAPTTSESSTYVAPTSTTPEYTAATTTAASSSAYSAPASSSAAPTGGSLSGTYYPTRVTFYDLLPADYVSCGSSGFSDSDNIVAMAEGMMDKDTMCGKQIQITYNGVTETATVQDTCPGCSGSNLDLTPSLFAKFAVTSAGVLPSATWSWM